MTLSEVVGVLLLFLQMGDLVTTYKAITSGRGVEDNPIMVKLASYAHLPFIGHWTWLVVTKSLAIIGLAIVLIKYPQEGWLLAPFIALLPIYAVVVYNNWRLYK